MDGKAQSLCASKVPGDTYRNLDVQTNYSGQTFKHILTPVWLLTYRYGQRLFQVAINGYDGRDLRALSQELDQDHPGHSGRSGNSRHHHRRFEVKEAGFCGYFRAVARAISRFCRMGEIYW